MIIFVEDRQPLFEVVEAVGKREYNILRGQMKQNPELYKILTTPIVELDKYKHLADVEVWKDDPIFKNATLLEIIVGTMKRSARGLESYFVKSSKGLYVGFIAISIIPEDGRQVVDGVKTFSFSLDDSDDENQMYKDLPAFMDKCLAKYKKVSWTAIEGNKANRAYAIYTKRRKGTISKDGKYIRYVCQKK